MEKFISNAPFALVVVCLVVGFVLLIKGADFFVEGSSSVAKRLHIPAIIIGLTIVAMGTSLPETAVSISAALKGSAEISLGNILGSNILNILLILGLTALICPVAVQKSTIRYEIPYVVLVSAVLMGIGYTDHMLSRLDGLILWALMICYLLYLRRMVKSGEETLEGIPGEGVEMPVWKMLLMIVAGGACIVVGSNLAVDSASELARIFGMSERLIGLTIVAFGTSLPELVTSVTAAVKGKADIAVGNIVGSNIFNILLVIGTSSLITPIVYAESFLVDSIVCIAVAILLWLCVFRNRKLSRMGGAILLIADIVYFIYLVR